MATGFFLSAFPARLEKHLRVITEVRCNLRLFGDLLYALLLAKL